MNIETIPEEARIAIHQGQIIEAIKVLRTSRNLGLKEAKDLVDSYLQAHPELAAQRRVSLSSGALLFWGAVGIAILVLVLK